MPLRRISTKDAEAQLHDQTNLLPRRQLIATLFVLASTLLVCFVDQNGVGVMLPIIGHELRGENTISWAGTSSLIANTVFQMLYGRLSDLFGRKLVFMSAVALLSLGDLVCGFAQNPTMLYIFRGVAGIGGGGIVSLTSMIVSDIVTLERRGKFQGILGATMGLGNLVGPLIAAGISERWTWRGFFYCLCPVGLAGFVMDYFLLPSNMPSKDFKGNLKKIDYLGTLTASLGLICLLVPISGGGSYFDWESPMVIAMLSVGSVLTVAFVFVEVKFARLPMLPASLFTNTATAVLLGQNFFYGAVYYSNIYFLPLYYQNVRQYKPIVSGLLLAPIVFSQSVSSVLSGLYISKFKRYGEVIWAGFTLWTLGACLATLFDRSIPPAAIVVISICMGTGIGSVFQPTIIAMQAHCRKSQRAVVISARNFLRSLGGASGLAISSAVLQTSLKRSLPPEFEHLASSSYSTPDYSKYGEADRNTILDAYATASRMVFITMAPFMGVCWLSYWLVKDRGLTRPGEEEEESNGSSATATAEQADHPDDDATLEANTRAEASYDGSRDGGGTGKEENHASH